MWPLWVILGTLILVPLLLWVVVVLPPRLLNSHGLGVEQRLKTTSAALW